MVVTLENKMFFNPLCLGQYKNEKVQMDSPKKKAVGEKIVVMGEGMAFRVQNLVLWYDGAILTERRSA